MCLKFNNKYEQIYKKSNLNFMFVKFQNLMKLRSFYSLGIK